MCHPCPQQQFWKRQFQLPIRGFVQDTGTRLRGCLLADVGAPRGASNGIPTGDGAGPGSFFDLQNVQC